MVYDIEMVGVGLPYPQYNEVQHVANQRGIKQDEYRGFVFTFGHMRGQWKMRIRSRSYAGRASEWTPLSMFLIQ